LVPPRDPAAMAAAVSSIWSNAGSTTALRQAGIQNVARYAWPQVAPRLLGVYARALGVASLNHCATTTP
jgi:glycosyltransferase involved in cell wall biosynthesis